MWLTTMHTRQHKADRDVCSVMDRDFIDSFGPDPTGGRRHFINLGLALRMIREAVEDCAPPGTVANRAYLMPEPWLEAEALVRGIYAIAERQSRGGAVGSATHPLTNSQRRSARRL